MKKIFKLFILLLLFFVVLVNRERIEKFIIKQYIYFDKPVIKDANPYHLSYDFNYIKETDDFEVKNEEQLKMVVYTFLNNGWDDFAFYCTYDDCIDDLSEFSNKEEYILLNNFLHPFNTYRKLYVSVNSFGRVHLSIDKIYSEEEITLLNNEIDKIIEENIKPNMTDKEKIKAFHDYIVNHTKYDSEYIELDKSDLYSPSHSAIGVLVNHKALCGGYTDIMSIFLNRLNIPNYKISTDNHIWNLVNIDGKWLHLDATWDDPVLDTGEELILDKFFLITTEKLKSFKTEYHSFDKNIFKEAN